MTLITFTINLAFEDVAQATADGMRDALVTHAIDGLGAEIAFTSNATEQKFPEADVDYNAEDADGRSEQWHAIARERLEAKS